MSAETQGWNQFEIQGSDFDDMRMKEVWSELGEAALTAKLQESPKSNTWIILDKDPLDK